MSRVVIVGAGLGGLASALRLADMGHDVTVCESADQVGGKLGVWSRGGYSFDTGPSLLTMPQVIAELFSDVGEDIDDHLTLRPVAPIARYRWPDGTSVDSSADAQAMTASLTDAFGAQSAAEWQELMALARHMWAAVEHPVLRSPSKGLRSFAPLLTRGRALQRLRVRSTLRDLGGEYLADPRMRMMLDRYATYTGSDPRQAPAALLTVAYAELTFGGWYIDGGLHRLAEVVADLALARGVKVRLSTPVDQITVSGGRVNGVTLASTERLPADMVISAGDAHVTSRNLLAPDPKQRRAPPQSLSGFVVLVGVTGTTPGLAHHNVFFPTDYDAEFDAIFGSQVQPVQRPTIYLSRPVDTSCAPEGAESWFILVNAPLHSGSVVAGQRGSAGAINWDEPGLADDYADALLRQLAHAGVSSEGRVQVCQTVSPADLQRRTGAPGGAIYGSSSNGTSAAFLRAANQARVSGLFFVGGSAHPGGGLPLVTLSAANTARLIGPPQPRLR